MTSDLHCFERCEQRRIAVIDILSKHYVALPVGPSSQIVQRYRNTVRQVHVFDRCGHSRSAYRADNGCRCLAVGAGQIPLPPQPSHSQSSVPCAHAERALLPGYRASKSCRYWENAPRHVPEDCCSLPLGEASRLPDAANRSCSHPAFLRIGSLPECSAAPDTARPGGSVVAHLPA